MYLFISRNLSISAAKDRKVKYNTNRERPFYLSVRIIIHFSCLFLSHCHAARLISHYLLLLISKNKEDGNSYRGDNWKWNTVRTEWGKRTEGFSSFGFTVILFAPSIYSAVQKCWPDRKLFLSERPFLLPMFKVSPGKTSQLQHPAVRCLTYLGFAN